MSWIGPDAVCLVTGGSAGIGFETGRGLARLGATVIITGRNPERTAAAVRKIADVAGDARASSYLADFSSLEAVRELAAAVLRDHPRLDVLINNAGLWHRQRRLSQDGYEDTFAVNHLAPFLLTNLLLEGLRRSDQARVVNVSSRLHRKAKAIQFDDIHSERYRRQGLAAYGHSKLANVLFSNELARRLAGTTVTSNAVHPGGVATSVTRGSTLARIGAALMSPFLKTPVQGAATSLYVATSDELAGVTGKYFAERAMKEPSKAALDRQAAAELWALSERMTGL